MNCLKCGRETVSEQVFCEECLLDMQKHPVKPGTVVLLPRRRETAAPKKAPKRRTLPLEEQVKLLRMRSRWMALLLLICVVLILTMIYPSIQFMMTERFEIGQNYTAIVSSTAPSEDRGFFWP